jgi:hypothetical protein
VFLQIVALSTYVARHLKTIRQTNPRHLS